MIAQADSGRYAFFRGQTELGPEPKAPVAAPAPAEPPKSQTEQSGQAGPAGAAGLLDNLQRDNSTIQGKNSESLQNFYKQNKAGVKVKDAY